MTRTRPTTSAAADAAAADVVDDDDADDNNNIKDNDNDNDNNHDDDNVNNHDDDDDNNDNNRDDDDAANEDYNDDDKLSHRVENHDKLSRWVENHDLPPDFVIEGETQLTPEQTRHRLVFYQHAMTRNAKLNKNAGMMDKEKYDQIHTATLRHHLGEKSYNIKKDNNPLFYAWIKKYAILDVGETHVLVERPKKMNNAAVEGVGAEFPDQDKLRRPTYMERLYEDMLSEHGLHNMCETFHKRLANKYTNIAMPWVKLFTSTCPGCIAKMTM